MAASSITTLNEDFLTCNICFEIFKEPKILSCLHTFCRHCLEKHVGQGQSNTITCPLCRQDSPLPKEGVCRLKNNFYIQNLIEFSESTSTQIMGRKCSFCSLMGKDTIAYSKCLTCRDFLCPECHNRHNFTTETINHETATLEDLQSGKHHEKLRSQQQIPCPEHAGESLRYFCDTCNLSVCRDCVILNHRDHGILAPSDAIKKRRQEIGDLLQALEKKATKFKEKSAVLREQEEKIDSNELDISHLIRETVEKMVKRVQAEGKAAGDKVKSELKVRRDEIARIKHKQDEKSKLLDNVMGICRKVIKDGLEGEIVFLQEMIRDRLLFLESNVEEEEEIPKWLPPFVQISKMVDGEASLDLFRVESKLRSENSVNSATKVGRSTTQRVAQNNSLASTSRPSSLSKSTPNLAMGMLVSYDVAESSVHLSDINTVRLKRLHIIKCDNDTNAYDPKLTSVAWFDNDSFVVADEANGKVMHYSSAGKLLKMTTLRNVITLACEEKIIFCGLKSGLIKMIKGDSKITEINTKGYGYTRPLVTLKGQSSDTILVAIEAKNLIVTDIKSNSSKSLPIINEKGHQIEIDPKYPHFFRQREIIVSDWISDSVYFLKLNGKVTKVYRRYDKGSWWSPSGLACDTKNNVFIADYFRNELTVLNSMFRNIDTIKLKKVTNPRCMACSKHDKLLITSNEGVAVFQISHA